MPAFNNVKGFSLLEVLIAMLLAAIALLGLAAAQLKALQYVSSSLQLTYAGLELQNVVERIWPQLCQLQGGSTAGGAPLNFTLNDFVAENYAMSLQITLTDNALPDFTTPPYTNTGVTSPLSLSLSASWQDFRLDNDQSLNSLELVSSFPWLINGNPDGC